MSISEKDILFKGSFSKAGIVSEDKFNILEEFKKIKNKKNNYYHDSYHPDKEWQESLLKKEIINPSEIIKGCKFNIDELKSEIKKRNIYYKDEFPKKMNKNLNTKNKKDKKIKRNLKKKNINRKYKYHDLHMKRIQKYKKEGLYDKILIQQESTYYPKLDFVYKKIESGPKWEKLAGRGKLFDFDNKKIHSISMDSMNYKDKNNFNISLKKIIVPKIIYNRNKKINPTKRLESTKYFNNMAKSTCNYSKENVFNNHNYISSISDNMNINNKNLFSFNRNKERKDFKKLILKNPKRTLLSIHRCKSVIDFGKYMDYEKQQKKIERNHENNRIRDVLYPNYSYIEGEAKTFVKYNNKNNNNKGKNKTIKFEGINSNELLYDANYTFEKIYGNKIRAVPIFHKMMARPNDINLPSYMKGLYSRMGLLLVNEKTLQMNNHENAKMYNFDGDFNPKKSQNYFVRKVIFEDEVDKDKNKIGKDFELMKKKFDKIQFNIVE